VECGNLGRRNVLYAPAPTWRTPSVIRHPSSVVRHLSSVIRPPSSALSVPLSSVLRPQSPVLCPPSSVTCPLSSVLSHLSSVVSHPSSVVSHPSSVVRRLSSVLCPLSSVLRPPSSVVPPASSLPTTHYFPRRDFLLLPLRGAALVVTVRRSPTLSGQDGPPQTQPLRKPAMPNVSFLRAPFAHRVARSPLRDTAMSGANGPS
jgi:hypothetical protein